MQEKEGQMTQCVYDLAREIQQPRTIPRSETSETTATLAELENFNVAGNHVVREDDNEEEVGERETSVVETREANAATTSRSSADSHSDEFAGQEMENATCPGPNSRVESGVLLRVRSQSLDFLPVPRDQALLPYIDSFLENVHPICCNNFLHPGVLGEGFDKAPRLLVLAICGASSKFLPGADSHERGRRWIAEARDLAYRSLDHISSLTISAIQFLAMHDMHEAQFTSAWNLIGIASRMALQLKLGKSAGTDLSPNERSRSFLQQECHRRLMWSVFVSDLLFACDESHINEQWVADLPLPCNLWSFTQGIPCKTLRLPQLGSKVNDIEIKQATNPCAYLIGILVLRRKILNFVQRHHDYDVDSPWLDGSYFQDLRRELENWMQNLPKKFAFEGRHMYTFRTSRHLDIFLMIHAYYHQCGYELFGAWMLGHSGSHPTTIYLPTAPEFSQLCAEKCLSHARDITFLIDKVLKLEPHHLFRDAWFALCILDSTRIQVAALQQTPVDDGNRQEVAESLKVNLQALYNTKGTILLAERAYQECCTVIRLAGLGELVGLSDHNDIHPDPSLTALQPQNSRTSLFRRYPFFQPSLGREQEAKVWDDLLNASNFAPSREPSPDRAPISDGDLASHDDLQQHQQRQQHLGVAGLASSLYPDEMSEQLFARPWSTQELAWVQQQQQQHPQHPLGMGVQLGGEDSAAAVLGGLGHDLGQTQAQVQTQTQGQASMAMGNQHDLMMYLGNEG
ncbi:MAG: hypothetical protein M1818_004978 [Claussenomyces sp. TS43310]|nr:MAG: hypothetical protein M1818_004978 [Claussenomyces sp. TS43310]